MQPRIFGYMPDGTAVEEYTLENSSITCKIITYGGAVRTLEVPDKNGKPVDVVLGYDTLQGYIDGHDKYFGALIGRYANRIKASRFELNGKQYKLFANNGPNHLHGGKEGFDAKVWKVEEASQDSLKLSLFSPDGEEGYPGDLYTEVIYSLTENGLSIDYRARCSADTFCSLTNHSYFNLSGHDAGSITGHTIQIFADEYTPTDKESIPTGEIAPVENTPMDLRLPTVIGEHIDEDFHQLNNAGGYDCSWIVRGEKDSFRLAAKAVSPESGIAMSVFSTKPEMQFYTGNYLDGNPSGKNGALYPRRSAFCLEAQYYPDSPNHDNFPSALLRPGEEYHHKTVYSFSAEQHKRSTKNTL